MVRPMVALLALALALAPKPSPAQLAEAQTLARRAIAEYDLGRFDDSLRDAQQAYLLDPIPGLLFDVAQAQRALHHWEQAAYSYRAYLRAKPAAKNRAEVEQLITQMDASQRQEIAMRAKEAVPPAPAAPQAPLVLIAPPPAAAPRTQAPLATTAAPMAATSIAAPAPHSHTAGIVLASLAGVGALTGLAGALGVAGYDGRVAQFNQNTSPQLFKGGAANAQRSANIDTAVELLGIVVALGCGAAAALTW